MYNGFVSMILISHCNGIIIR